MNGFDSTEEILKKIYENGGCYIWGPINCNASNHVLGSALRDLAIEGFLSEASKGWWIFKDSKLSYTLTDKGLQKLGF